MVNKYVGYCFAALLSMAANFAMPVALAQEQISQVGLDLEQMANLPDDIEDLLVIAMSSGDGALIAAAITQAVAMYPDMVVQIARSAARANPSAAPVVAGAAASAVMASGNSTASAVLAISQAVVQVAPSYAPRISVAVFQSLPASMRDTANMNLILSSVQQVLPAQDTQALQAVASALSSVAANTVAGLTTQNVVQAPVSGT